MAVALFSEATVSTSLTLGSIPPARVGPSITSLQNKLYVFGGRIISPAKISNDLYSFDLNSMAWELISSSSNSQLPASRYFHSAVIFENHLVIIGGQGEPESESTSKLLNDICFFNFQTKEWDICQFDQSTFPCRYAHLASISGRTLIIVGGQDVSNQYLTDFYLFNIDSRSFIKTCSIDAGLGSYRTTLSLQNSNSFAIFNNTRFNKPLRELIFIDLEGQTQKIPFSDNEGKTMPPAFRFPEGYIIDDKMVISGTYMSNNVQSYCIWCLDINSKTWSRVDTGSCFARGSWNRGILHPSSNSFVVFGHREREIVLDYSHRRINFNHVSVVNLEAFNIYRNPKASTDDDTIKLGLQMMYEPRFSNFSLLTNDDFRIHINTGFIRSRWKNFDTFLYSRHDQSQTIPYLKTNTLLLQESYAVVQTFVRYLYTNTLSSNSELDIELLGKLLVFSRNYAINHFSDLVASRLHSLLDIDVAPKIFQIASLAKRDGLKLRSLSFMIQDRQKLMSSSEFWIEYPANLRKEILLYMPPNSKPPPHLLIETVPSMPRPTPPPSRKIDNSKTSTESTANSSRVSIDSISTPIPESNSSKTTDSQASSPMATVPKKKISGSSFLKFGSRRPSLANLLGFSSSSNNNTPKPPTSSSSTSSNLSVDPIQPRKRAGSTSNPGQVSNNEDHILQSLYDFGLS